MRVWLVALALVAAAGRREPPTLLDQLGREDALAAHRGRPVVAFVVTAKKLRSIRGFEEDLRRRFEEIDYLRVVDVPAHPPTTHDRVAAKLRERVPRDVGVLIDLENAWARTFELDTAEVNVLVFDPDQSLVGRFRGRKDKTLIEQVAEAVAPLARAKAPASKDAR